MTEFLGVPGIYVFPQVTPLTSAPIRERDVWVRTNQTMRYYNALKAAPDWLISWWNLMNIHCAVKVNSAVRKLWRKENTIKKTSYFGDLQHFSSKQGNSVVVFMLGITWGIFSENLAEEIHVFTEKNGLLIGRFDARILTHTNDMLHVRKLWSTFIDLLNKIKH